METDVTFGKVGSYKPKKNEEYMSQRQREYFKDILLAWREQLLEKTNNTLKHINSDTTNLADQNDRASLEEEFSIELRTRDRENKLVHKIDKSVFEIEKGNLSNYGYCVSCGSDIGFARLEARPTADMCIDCKELDEIKEKILG